ncbi:OmpA family protein [Myxococcus sp. K15C18031901]|uniref:OmpA family protein n=1 Tax=Myxococcus dinghuensis TaxID=2906761 RepID=UPI0020A7FB3B|nr:OmpA family protein [Myxococcus dinghuensis]MCP3098515.1 OmpA family protein [Myxococcus dinghuensis]
MRPYLPLLLVVSSLAGCAARTQVQPDSSTAVRPPSTVAPPQQAAAPVVSTTEQDALPLDLEPVYFELDSTTLRPEFQDTLLQLAEAMRRHPDSRVSISGHTCELGTTEYNLALGQRRAAVVKDYLRRLGVAPARIATLSFGEERPLSSTELAKNRRAELNVSAGAHSTRGAE